MYEVKNWILDFHLDWTFSPEDVNNLPIFFSWKDGVVIDQDVRGGLGQISQSSHPGQADKVR